MDSVGSTNVTVLVGTFCFVFSLTTRPASGSTVAWSSLSPLLLLLLLLLLLPVMAALFLAVVPYNLKHGVERLVPSQWKEFDLHFG